MLMILLIQSSFQCSTYITVEELVTHAMSMDRDSLLAKIDIKTAYRLVPVFPTDCTWLGMCWKDQVYGTLQHACTIIRPGRTFKKCNSGGYYIKQQKLQRKYVMQILRTLFFVEAHYQLRIVSQHIAGSSNNRADYLSRNQIGLFHASHITVKS